MTLMLVPVLIVTAYLVGLGVGAALDITSADLTVVVVVAVGLARGSVPGASAGFGAGLLLDVAPGSTYPVGSGALAGTVAGALFGLLNELGDRKRPSLARFSPVGGATLAAAITAAALLIQVLVRTGVGTVLGAEPGLPRPALVLPALGTVLVAGLSVPGLTVMLSARNGT